MLQRKMIFPREPCAVIFDMDGLLFDTESLHRRAAEAAAERQGCEMPLSLFHGLIGLSATASRAFLVDRFAGRLDLALFEADWDNYFNALVQTELLLKAGVAELLDLLDELDLPRAIATSSSRASVAHHLAQHGLGHRFHAVVAQGDYSRGKPAPDPFLTAAQRLDIHPADCLALEDSYNGVRSAAAAGMMTIMVPDLLVATDEMTQLTLHVAGDLHEVQRLLRA